MLCAISCYIVYVIIVYIISYSVMTKSVYTTRIYGSDLHVLQNISAICMCGDYQIYDPKIRLQTKNSITVMLHGVMESQINSKSTAFYNSLFSLTRKETVKLPIIGPLWRKSTSHRWIPLWRASNAQSVSRSWRHQVIYFFHQAQHLTFTTNFMPISVHCHCDIR